MNSNIIIPKDFFFLSLKKIYCAFEKNLKNIVLIQNNKKTDENVLCLYLLGSKIFKMSSGK